MRELRKATAAQVRVLSADEEGRLAFAGAVAAAPTLRGASRSATSGAVRRRPSSGRPRAGRRGRARSTSARSGSPSASSATIRPDAVRSPPRGRRSSATWTASRPSSRGAGHGRHRPLAPQARRVGARGRRVRRGAPHARQAPVREGGEDLRAARASRPHPRGGRDHPLVPPGAPRRAARGLPRRAPGGRSPSWTTSPPPPPDPH